MERAGQTPHGARPNREGAGSERKLRLARAGSARHNLRVGRLSCAVMRGPEEWPSCGSNPADRIRLIGPAAFIYFESFGCAQDFGCELRFAHARKTPQLTGPAAFFSLYGSARRTSCPKSRHLFPDR